MPKTKADRVVVHRIEFQKSEREMLNMIATGYTAEKLSKSVFNLTSDVTSVVVLILLYEMLTGKETGVLDALANLGDDVLSALVDGFRNYRQTEEYREDYAEDATSVWGGLGNMFEQIIYALSGGAARDQQERWDEQGGVMP